MSFAIELAKGMGFLTVNEVKTIQMVVKLLPRHAVCINIGSGAGTSAIAVLETRPDVFLVDIDIDPANGLAQIKEAGFFDSERYQRITGDSKEVAWDQLCDYLFVDGDHFEPGIRGDLVTWLPRVRKGGYVLLHDYWPYPADHELAGVDYWPAVRQVADQLMNGTSVLADVDRIRVYQV